MFLNEARIAAQVRHPNVVSVHDLEIDEGRYFLAMDYVCGETLSSVLGATWNKKKPLPWQMTVAVIAKICEGLHAVHELQDPMGRPLKVVHRDVAPQNIMVGYDGQIYLMDFGIAKALSSVSHTKPGIVRGTVAYLSPEQVRGQAADRRSDLFSVGTILWESTVGLRLFKHDSELGTATRILKMEVPKPSDFQESYPNGLEEVILKALSRDPEKRFQTAQELADALHDVLAKAEETVRAGRISEFMKSTFGERYDERLELQRQAREEEPPQGLTQPGSRSDVNNLDELSISDDVSFDDLSPSLFAGLRDRMQMEKPAKPRAKSKQESRRRVDSLNGSHRWAESAQFAASTGVALPVRAKEERRDRRPASRELEVRVPPVTPKKPETLEAEPEAKADAPVEEAAQAEPTEPEAKIEPKKPSEEPALEEPVKADSSEPSVSSESEGSEESEDLEESSEPEEAKAQAEPVDEEDQDEALDRAKTAVVALSETEASWMDTSSSQVQRRTQSRAPVIAACLIAAVVFMGGVVLMSSGPEPTVASDSMAAAPVEEVAARAPAAEESETPALANHAAEPTEPVEAAEQVGSVEAKVEPKALGADAVEAALNEPEVSSAEPSVSFKAETIQTPKVQKRKVRRARRKARSSRGRSARKSTKSKLLFSGDEL